VTYWLSQAQTGDTEAAQQLWQRYFGRLVALARVKLQGSSRDMAPAHHRAQTQRHPWPVGEGEPGMTNPASDNPGLSQAERIDQVCTAFEAACKTGPAPRLEDWLRDVPGVDRLSSPFSSIFP
jgi:hypothetical protein